MFSTISVSSLVVALGLLGTSVAYGQTQTAISVAEEGGQSAATDVQLLERPAMVRIADADIADALQELSEASGVFVAFSRTQVSATGRRASCDCASVTVRDALNRILTGTPFEYMPIRGQIVVFPRTDSRSTMPAPAMGQLAVNTVASVARWDVPLRRVQLQGTISGRVVDASTQQPLSTVQVYIDALDVGTLTNPEGRYILSNVPAGQHTLVAEVIGYQPASQVVTVVDDSVVTVNFELVQTAVALDEIVAVGYATQTRATVSGSVSTINNEDIERTSSTTTADMLVGKIAGINTRAFTSAAATNFAGRVPTDGRPGASTGLQIRNMGDPLFIIDGVPATSMEFNQLNAADIENISILKDASAAIYGFRASNGVVLVTTKSGRAMEQPQLRVSGYWGWQWIDRSRSPFGYANNAYQFMYSQVESQQNRGQPRTIPFEELEKYRLGVPGYESYEAFPMVVNNQGAKQANISASLSGGSGSSSYYLSLGHVTQDYVMVDNNFNRTNLQANLQTNLFDFLRIGTELRGRLENHNTVSITNVDDPITVYFQSIQSTWPHENWYANGNPNYINAEVRYIIRSPAIFRRDISGTQDQIRKNFTGNFWAEFLLPFGTRIRGTYSRTADSEEFDIHRYPFNAYCYDEETDIYNLCYTYGDHVRQSLRAHRDSDFANITLTHNHNFGPHSIVAVAGLEKSGGESTTSDIRSIPPTTYNSQIDFVDVTNANTSWSINRRASYFGRLNYDYEQRYIVELIGRYDGSYLYAPGKRWGFFPGVTAAWRLTEEQFIQDRFRGFLDELKLRLSWGQTGREQGVSAWGYLGGGTYGQGSAVLDGQRIIGVQPRGIPVTNLSWVTAISKNVGVDFTLWGGRLAGVFDVFERKLTGIPAARYDVLLPSEVGYTLPNENLESESQVGFDGMIRYSDRIGPVAFSIAPNVTLSRRKILDRYKPRYGNSWDKYRNGTEHRWQGVAFGYRVIGQFQSVEEILNHPVNIDGQGNRTLLPGDLIFEDVNGDGIINALDQRPIGWPGGAASPMLNFGLNGTISYRGFTLSHDWAGAAMYDYNPSADLRIPYTSDHNGGAFIWSRWRRADPYDDNSEWIPGKYPPLRKAQNSHSSYRDSNFTRLNMKYLRLRRIELGYNLPSDLTNWLGMRQTRMYVSAQNAWMLDNGRYAIDPESAQCCGQIYPTPMVVNIGFSATLGPSTASTVALPD